MNKLKLRMPTRIIQASVRGSNKDGQTVFVRDYTGLSYVSEVRQLAVGG